MIYLKLERAGKNGLSVRLTEWATGAWDEGEKKTEKDLGEPYAKSTKPWPKKKAMWIVIDMPIRLDRLDRAWVKWCERTDFVKTPGPSVPVGDVDAEWQRALERVTSKKAAKIILRKAKRKRRK